MKKDFWPIVVNKTVVLKVVFDEPVTAEEALELYNNDEYADVIDEQECFSEAVEVEQS